MKLGFSTVACPDWDLATVVRQAKELGYHGVEVAVPGGRATAPSHPPLTADPSVVKQLFDTAGVELVCLGTPVRLYGSRAGHAEAARAQACAYLDLAARLDCPRIRVFGGDIAPNVDRNAVLAEIAAVLRELARAAAAANVEILLENDAAVAGSRDIWFILDAVGHPAVRCCWSSVQAIRVRERPTLSVPRLGTRIGLVHACDTRCDSDGRFQGYELPGQGQAELPRLLELLRGIAYDGYVVFDWPKAAVAALAPPETSLPAAAQFLKGRIEAKGEVLSAYKGDKTLPRFALRPVRPPLRTS